MVVGYTKFSHDGNFGVLKRYFRNNRVSSLSELCDVIINIRSTNISKINDAILVTDERNNMFVNIYDWQSSFKTENCKKFLI